MTILVFLAFVVFVGTQDLPWWAIAALIFGVGSNSGDVMVMTHELGHKANKLDRLTAKIGNMLMGYGHFNTEHNKGHHTWVATPEDPASSRMGESFYAFMVRELSGTFKRGITYEKGRLKNQGRPFWSVHNDLLQVYSVTLGLIGLFVVLYGPAILLFLIPHHYLAWLALTQANYVEHYGLMREKKPNGKYERCQPKHSWNTNHTYSNLLSSTCNVIPIIMPIRSALIRSCGTIRMSRLSRQDMAVVSLWPSSRRFGSKSWISASWTGQKGICPKSTCMNLHVRN